MGAAAALLPAQAGPVFGQATGETLDYLNARLLHSSILRVDEAGLVRMRTPGETLTFNLKDAAINGNDQNFSCRSESDAKVVRAALEFIRGQVKR